MTPDHEQLLAALEEAFPDRAPSLGLSPDRVWFNAGAAHVVRWIRDRFEEQDRIIRGEEG